ncbi:hypothetical protein ACHQM5_003315 [Ranunculus cassubicifolius]
MLPSPIQIPAILLLLTLTISLSQTPLITSHLLQPQSLNTLICQIEETKLKITHLESILEKSVQSLDMKFNHLAEKTKSLEEMTKKIDFLHTVLADLKVDSAYTDERINKLEEEVKLLWAASRKNNFDIHLLESKVQTTDGTIHAVISKVQKMQDIVTEQWIQIRQLDQALKITEMRSLEAQRRASSDRCTFLKFISEIFGNYLPSKTLSESYFSPALHQLRNSLKAVKTYHHEVQGYVKETMEMNEFTTAFANQEIIFFVASALIMLPLWVGFMVILSYYS